MVKNGRNVLISYILEVLNMIYMDMIKELIPINPWNYIMKIIVYNTKNRVRCSSICDCELTECGVCVCVCVCVCVTREKFW